MGNKKLSDYILANEPSFASKARLSSLYSDFSPLRVSNPDGFEANLRAWRTALLNASRDGILTTDENEFCLSTGEELGKELEIQGLGRPASLGLVVNELVAKKDLVPLKEFLESKSSIYEQSAAWLPHFTLPTARDIAQWSLRQIGVNIGSSADIVRGDFAVISKLEEAASEIIGYLSNPASDGVANHVYSLETFTHAFSRVHPDSEGGEEHVLSPLDVRLLLTYLVRDKRVARTSYSESTDQTTIKLSATTASPPSEITETDITLANLYTLSHRLSQQIDALQSRVTTLDSEARRAISSSPAQKSVAMRCLRSKKLAEATLTKRDEALLTVQGAINDIEDAATRVDVVHALDGAGKVLEHLNAEVGGVEGVEEVLDRLREGRLDAEDVASVVAEYGNVGVVNEDEVDEEVEALEREEKEKNEALEAEKLEQRLPNVPSAVPGSVEHIQEQQEDDDLAMKMSTASLEETDIAQKQL